LRIKSKSLECDPSGSLSHPCCGRFPRDAVFCHIEVYLREKDVDNSRSERTKAIKVHSYRTTRTEFRISSSEPCQPMLAHRLEIAFRNNHRGDDLTRAFRGLVLPGVSVDHLSTLLASLPYVWLNGRVPGLFLALRCVRTGSPEACSEECCGVGQTDEQSDSDQYGHQRLPDISFQQCRKSFGKVALIRL
jgi:hypothetical protein